MQTRLSVRAPALEVCQGTAAIFPAGSPAQSLRRCRPGSSRLSTLGRRALARRVPRSDSLSGFRRLLRSQRSRSRVIVFSDSLFTLDSGEVFIDCGAYDGDTLREVIRRSGEAFSRIVALEPDPASFAAIQRY